MSNNLISQQFPIQSLQIGQLEPILNKMDSPLPEMRMMGNVRSVSSNNPMSQQFLISSKQTELVESISNNPVSQGLSAMNFQMGQMEAQENRTMESQQFLTPNNEIGQMGSMLNNVGLQQLSANFKRKAPMEPNPHNSMSHKRMAQMEHRPWLQQVSGSNKRVVQLESVPNAPASQHLPSPNKRTVKMESFSNKSVLQRSSSQKNQNAQMQPSPKASTESSESVRSKMRESLAAALSLVNQLKNKPLNSQSEAGNSLGRTEENPQPGGSAFSAGNTEPITEVSKDTLRSIDSCSDQKSIDGRGGSQIGFADVRTDDSNLTSVHDRREFQSCNVLPYDVSFSENLFVKDELLQGNGLSWVLDSDMQLTETKEIQASGKQSLDCGGVGGDMVEQATSNLQYSPQHLASKIEAELFKLFGGVNKKYKEKGRSLLFNLKDRNNPELRERVMSGEIPPERLCSMTAEELASKELSQWRMAKAEELAQMVVLPDSEVDIRRLVKKTHKGEFQVEVEQDDIVPAEVSVGTSSLGQSQTRSKDSTRTPKKPDGGKSQLNASGENRSSGDQNGSYTLTIPSIEGTDLLQGLMVDDGLKDAEFLPPIVSLDEFMESLDSEPPFENIPVDTAKMTPNSDKDDSEVGSELKSTDPTPKDTVDASLSNLDNVDDNVSTNTNLDADMKSNDSDLKSNDGDSDVNSRGGLAGKKSNDSPVESETALSSTQKGEHVWGGLLQVNISTTASVIGIFKSGEKTSAKEWPGFLEIKGRVRLDAFEKFLQELPLSRSRAVMVVHFVLKVGSPENEQASLQEVADSYIVDERVGFAEPAPGVELYFCPPHNKTLEMLGKIIQKEHIEAVNAIDNGLIGVIVWRKLTTTSPKSSSQHKHMSKKNHFSSRRHQDTNLNAKYTTPKSASSRGKHTNPGPSPDDDDDDIPPGFGPPASRDEDDLPEFNFSGGSNSSVPPFSAQNPNRGMGVASFRTPSQTSSRPVDQMRELVQRYGQPDTSQFPGNWKDKVGGSGVAVQPWNDDDDDIPEWQPHAPQQQQTPLQQVHSFQQQQMPLPHFVNQPHLVPSHQPAHQTMPSQSLQPPINAANTPENHALWQHGTWWVPPVQGNNLRPEIGKVFGASGQGINSGQPGMAWQQNAPTSRGF